MKGIISTNRFVDWIVAHASGTYALSTPSDQRKTGRMLGGTISIFTRIYKMMNINNKKKETDLNQYHIF